MSALPRVVIALGVVSLLTDVASEMIYPLLPLFIAATLGGGTAAVGLIEGVAEATAALVKLAAGRASDRASRRKPLVVAGYAMASLARPLIGLAGSWPIVLLIRFADRIGKGVRTSPRDALLADATAPAHRGRAYGFHRAMDHAGAVAGPLVAAGLLGIGVPLGEVFLWAAVPGALAMVVLIGGVREPAMAPAKGSAEGPTGAEVERAGPPPAMRRLLVGLALFTLGNASDAFLLLRLGLEGLTPIGVALAWSALHAIKVLTTLVGGRLADRLPRRGLVAAGWTLHAVAYLGFGWFDDPAPLVAVFLVYGVSTGLTEPAERAWVSDLASAAGRGTAFGWFHATIGVCALPASALFGLLWAARGPLAAFGAAAALALAGAAVIAAAPPRPAAG